MIFIIFAIIGVGLGIWFGISNRDVLSGIGASFFLGPVAVFMAFLITIIAEIVPGPVKVVDTQTTAIYALQDGRGFEGHTFLGTGYVEDKLNYCYVYKTSNGGYKIGNVETKYCTIYYVENEDECRIEHLTYQFVNPIHNFLAGNSTQYEEYDVYVPKNSIISNYYIDLQ